MSVWDDPEIGDEETTPLPQVSSQGTNLSIAPERIEELAVQVLEKVAREIVPEIAEKAVREELDRLLQESEKNE